MPFTLSERMCRATHRFFAFVSRKAAVGISEARPQGTTKGCWSRRFALTLLHGRAAQPFVLFIALVFISNAEVPVFDPTKASSQLAQGIVFAVSVSGTQGLASSRRTARCLLANSAGLAPQSMFQGHVRWGTR